jgi:hypothetical protein
MIKKISNQLFAIEPFLIFSEFEMISKIIENSELKQIERHKGLDSWANEEVQYPSASISTKSENLDLSIFINSKIKDCIEQIFNCCVFEENGFSVTVYQKNEGLPYHWDNSSPDLPTPSGNPSRDISAILYLNSSFEGGVLHFVNLNKKINPINNMLLLFPSSELYAHRVETVTAGTRYMYSSFWSIKE